MKTISVLLLALALVACNKDPAEVKADVAKAMGAGDYAEAEEGLRWLLERDPKNTMTQANLAFALTSQGKDAEALAIYARLVEGGEGTYDLFAFYARSLAAVGRNDEAITWNYRALSLVPQLVDVRGNLAKVLVKQGRGYEALSLLTSFDDELQAKGQKPYFRGQRMSIASALPRSPAASGKSASFNAVSIGGHFYAVVIGKDDESLPFLIDTGASHTTMSREVLAMLGLSVPASAHSVRMQAADGYVVVGRQFAVPVLQVGPFALENQQVVVCDDCASLLGQSTLERFDLETTQKDGLEMLSMRLRPAGP